MAQVFPEGTFPGSISIVMPSEGSSDVDLYPLIDICQEANYFCTVWEQEEVMATLGGLNLAVPVTTEGRTELLLAGTAFAGEEMAVASWCSPAQLEVILAVRKTRGTGPWLAVTPEGQWLGYACRRLCPTTYHFLKTQLGVEGECLIEVSEEMAEAGPKKVVIDG
jgi:hypothetical protein